MLEALKNIWPMLILPGALVVGFIYRAITHQPFKGDVPPVGINKDLPSSITGINKFK